MIWWGVRWNIIDLSSRECRTVDCSILSLSSTSKLTKLSSEKQPVAIETKTQNWNKKS